MWDKSFADFKGCEKCITEAHHGIERENLRVSMQGEISKNSHPESLGSPLTSPFVSLDFSEVQLELITGHQESLTSLSKELESKHLFLQENLPPKELLWPLSMPAALPSEDEIPIARFGLSQLGQEKELYRKGLGYRYGKKMQMVSGVHYNFSLPQTFWDVIIPKNGCDKKAWVSEQYLHISRNALRHGWVLSYLFGASPCVDQSYFKRPPLPFHLWKEHTYYGPYACSLRMGKWGYYSKVQRQHSISYNSLETYVEDLKKALNTSLPSYERIGLGKRGSLKQINTNILQVAAEHYTRVRPKPKALPGEDVLTSLERHGVEYLELRNLDLDPFHPLGVSEEVLLFHFAFLVYCLFKKSPPISPREAKEICQNQLNVAMYGRKPKLKLTYENGRKISLKEWGKQIISEMHQVLSLFPKDQEERLKASLEQALERLEDSEKTPSAKVLKELFSKNKEFISWGVDQAQKFSKEKRDLLSPEERENLKKLSFCSLEEEAKIIAKEDYFLKGYEHLEISTQMLIREALKRGISVKQVLGDSHTFCLQKGKKKHYVYKATHTEKDPLISYFLMQNKGVTKQLLKEANINTPRGIVVEKGDDLESLLQPFQKDFLVVKPSETNCGVGISFISPKEQVELIKAVEKALTFGDSVVIETFCPGEEYRFLVIDNKCVAVCQRIPAHVVGDGIKTVKQLIDHKNENPRAYKLRYPILMGEEEEHYLKQQSLNFTSVPKQGEKVFLRQNSNVSLGGDVVEWTPEAPQYFKEIACRAAATVGAKICGVDIIIPDFFKGKDYHILELNFNPALWLHRYPTKGTPVYVEGYLLDYLGF